jgi:hypothetical protein
MSEGDKARRNEHITALRRIAAQITAPQGSSTGGVSAASAQGDSGAGEAADRSTASTTGWCCPDCGDALPAQPPLGRDARCEACRIQLRAQPRRRHATQPRTLRRRAVDPDALETGWL